MAEAKRQESSSPADAADRDSRAEALLVDGLDRYFSGQYDEAIHLWTRVLFFDRSHARARAYIDRARTALAERQRRSEEMLHRTSELLAAGDTAGARAWLERAAQASGEDERIAELGLRLDRLDRARGDADRRPQAAVVDAVPVGRWFGWPKRRVFLVAGVVVAAGVCGAVAAPVMNRWLSRATAMPANPEAIAAAAPAVPTTSEVSLIRARSLFSHGRLAEALTALDRVDPASAEAAASDALRIDIQRILLSSRRGLSASGASGGGQP